MEEKKSGEGKRREGGRGCGSWGGKGVKGQRKDEAASRTGPGGPASQPASAVDLFRLNLGPLAAGWKAGPAVTTPRVSIRESI